MAPCHRIPKGKAVNKATHSCLCSSPWVSTVRLKQPALSCGQGERIFAFLDDIYMVTMPERVEAALCHRGRTAARSSPNQDPRWQDEGVKASGPKFVMFLSALHGSRTPQLSCGEGLSYLS